jgi:hypothetical protein
MSVVTAEIPVVLFAYARPTHLARVLGCLRENRVPLVYAFADAAKGAADANAVAETRALLRGVDWCKLHVSERPENLGLGRNVLAGVSEVAARHEAFIVWEDDLICVPGTYAWMCAALRHYADDARVMSVSAWTHPRVTPSGVGDTPYFDGRAEAWSWGAYARSWRGMAEETALEKLRAAEAADTPADSFGADMPRMAREEIRRNIWAVRWFYHHLKNRGLCVRPPYSMVEHIGVEAGATNAAGSNEWDNPRLRTVPAGLWPTPELNAQCGPLWLRAFPPGRRARLYRWLRQLASA